MNNFLLISFEVSTLFIRIIRALFFSRPARRREPPRSRDIVTPFLRPVRKPMPSRTAVSSTQRHQPAQAPAHPHETTLTGKCYVVDGDTIRIGKVNIRLAGVDAPELEHPWGKKAKWELVNLCKGQIITAEIEPDLSYDRLVATCFLPDGRDLSAEMVRSGMALDWPKFSGGKYQHLEPEGVRKKYWKAAARQRGHMHVFHK
ncbi:thermonuclease family protein [Salinihabitans flavidus]|uniref:thermonuclease family protein n=1 Tax=Salinihabitans flavidus TaxID=569882 RepID=UPI001FDFF706|nr:thermonuclease family protein [Salinihabitans flavidus]